MSEKPKNSAGFLAGFFLALLNLATIAVTAFSVKNSDLALAALLMFIITGSYRAYLKGTLAELLSLARIGGAFAAAWFLRTHVAELLPVKGLLGEIAAFYAGFFLIYFSAGQGIALALKNHEPTMASKLLGSFIGAFEGLLIGLMVLLAIGMVPGSSLADNPPEMLRFVSGSTEKIIAPIIPDEAGNAVRAVKTMSRMAKGIDPEKVDSQAVMEVMQPLAEMPEIMEMQNNPEVQKLIEQRDIAGLVRHPALRKIMENPELQQKMLNLDWKKLERALGQ